ncbi:hypothetical protein ACS0TY_023069 [Phlomoides rotata]
MKFLSEDVFNGDKDVLFVNFRLSSEVVLLKTTKGLEGKYIDYLSSLTKKQILAVGSLVADADQTEDENSKILQWSSKKEPNSTVFLDMEKIMSIEEVLPQGFLGRVKDKGLVVSGCAPQANI